ncbi:MAG: ROK family transcriptional regulator, partial [Anaerolineales bacterium]
MSSGRRNIHTITAAEMREINRSSILEMIRSNSPISRTQIAEDLQVSLPTVMRIVDELMEDELIIEDGEREWSGGRKRKRLVFNGSQHLVIGIDLGGTKIYGAVADYNGKILHEIREEHHQTQAEESLAYLCSIIDQLLKFSENTNLPIRGIGIGVPGVVQPNTGIV